MWRWGGRRAVHGKSKTAGVALLAVLAIGLAACGPVSHAASGSYFPVIRAPVANISPTPGPLTYTVGTWVSNSSPLPSDHITVYVSFRNAGVPVAGGQATIQVNLSGGAQTYGPSTTDENGFASFSIYFASIRPGRPVVVFAMVDYQGTTYRNTTSFAAMPFSGIGIATPTQ